MEILVKVSGDVIKKEEFYNWLTCIANPLNRIFILCGGGSSITNALKEGGIPYEFGPQGREIKSLEGKRLALKILQKQKFFVERKLREKHIIATVLIPVIKITNKICHINGDSYAIALYPNFDKIYIITLKERTKFFPENLNKIKVVYL